MSPFVPRVLSLLLLLATGCASAHDTWFERLPSGLSGEVMLALGTGNRFPAHEFSVGVASLQQSGCHGPRVAKPMPLHAVRETPKALIVRTPPQTQGAITCWAQQQPFEVEIKPETVQVYFKEINPPPGVRTAWAEMQSRGVGWKERFTKHARIELPGSGPNPTPAQATGMGMDVLLQSGLQPVHEGDTLVFQVLRDGRPLPDLAVELRSELSPLGAWKRTDAQGRVTFQPPLAGHWVLRGTDLRLSDTVRDTWESRFVTLAFEVMPAP